MSDRVWIHYHTAGFYYLTPDGLHEIERARVVVLRDVEFIIDPLGQEGAKRREKITTHAWAVGDRVLIDESFDEAQLQKLHYDWRSDDEFSVTFEGTKLEIRGAEELIADVGPENKCIAWVVNPILGQAERRRVQQYGWAQTDDWRR